MFERSRWIIGTLLFVLLLAACQTAPAATFTPQPTPVPPTPTSPPRPTVAPTPVPRVDYGSWEQVLQTRADSSTYVAGFASATYGISAGYAGAIRYTTDGGQNWLRAENTSMCRFGLDIVDEHIAWHCGNGGAVKVSTDGGQTWQPGGVYGSSQPNHCRFLSFLDDKTGWAATAQKLGMTADGGATWTDLSLPGDIGTIAAIALLDGKQGYILDAQGGLFVTHDGSLTWTAHSIGLADDATLSTSSTPNAAMRFLDDQNGILVYQRHGQIWLARTADGGQMWQHELIPGVGNMVAFYLARDGRLLTLFDGSQVLVLQRPG